MNIQSLSMYTGGVWYEKQETFPLVSPVDQTVIAHISKGDQTDIKDAIISARKGYQSLKKRSAHERSMILERVSELIKKNKEELSRTISLETAKPIKDSRSEIDRTIITYKLAAEEAKRLNGETIPMDAVPGGENRLGYSIKEPLGIIAAITPFNFPFNLVAHKLGPAIAAGNAVLFKPAEQTPLSAIKITEIFLEAGLPKEAIQLVTGYGKELSDSIVKDEDIQKITFTGSVPVGKIIKENAGLKRTTLELGSNSALIVEPDTDIKKMAQKCVKAAFTFSGQICISLQRIFVHESCYDTFCNELVEKTKELRIGSPFDDNTDVAALISPDSFNRIKNWVEQAKNSGATVALGGNGTNNTFEPTILLNTDLSLNVCCEEVFGPVVSVISYKNLEEAISMVNESQFGLHTGLYTKDMNRALKAAGQIESGGVLINEVPTFRLDHIPYGGVKNSGYGREGIKYALDEMTKTKFVMVNLNE
ncbi:aldehyde dehydrogenase family protein [Evansella halocellulosilytica]|uniref:aldehyde dehydrogenase family protein n=1 Tax=Evansella halocellulosilytica TaxID=2011013 RepID=UPI000BB7E943|nr:aldehyde dehydrogenase family protein [Evansella halocellulosilytica]